MINNILFSYYRRYCKTLFESTPVTVLPFVKVPCTLFKVILLNVSLSVTKPNISLDWLTFSPNKNLLELLYHD